MRLSGNYTVRCGVCNQPLHSEEEPVAINSFTLNVHPCSKCMNKTYNEASAVKNEDIADKVAEARAEEQAKIETHWQAILNTGSK